VNWHYHTKSILPIKAVRGRLPPPVLPSANLDRPCLLPTPACIPAVQLLRAILALSLLPSPPPPPTPLICASRNRRPPSRRRYARPPREVRPRLRAPSPRTAGAGQPWAPTGPACAQAEAPPTRAPPRPPARSAARLDELLAAGAEQPSSSRGGADLPSGWGAERESPAVRADGTGLPSSSVRRYVIWLDIDLGGLLFALDD
jgi:hypothetical protein